MNSYNFLIFLVLSTVEVGVLGNDYYVKITDNSPVISGGVVKFNAKLFDGNKPASGTFKFIWDDNGVYPHGRTVETTNPYDSWAVNYTSDKYPPGPYIVQVTVYIKYVSLIPWYITSQRKYFTLTGTLNGNLSLYQNQTAITKQYVSNSTIVLHKVELSEPDAEYLNNSATSVLTYWFVDCVYYGFTDDYQKEINYTNAGETHKIEALVIADFKPFPVPTTTTTTTTTTAAPTTTKTTTSSNPVTALSVEGTVKVKTKRSSDLKFANSTQIVSKLNGVFVSSNESVLLNTNLPFICNNNSILPLSTDMTYGIFSKEIIVKEPIWNISVSGNNWIQRSDVLQLKVTCKGSSLFHFCYTFKDGIYNVTGNETCPLYDVSEKCSFNIIRYFGKHQADIHTAVIIIYNDVHKSVYPVTVNIYQVNNQAQLSVIVVPVTFSLVAIVLIIFAVAYYIQNRTRYTIEVADFNFGQQYVDMEYKTFYERLRESFSNAFTRAPIVQSESVEGPVWPPGRKYGSMT